MMKKILTLIAFAFFCYLSYSFSKKKPRDKDIMKPEYLQNRAPLLAKPYLELPIGAIQPMGWLKVQLEKMKDGSTGHLDSLYNKVMGKRNGWLGGDGDVWKEVRIGWMD